MQGSAGGASQGAIAAVIPARWASSRFPGKPLVDLLGVPMIVRVADQVARARRISKLVVATDDERVRDVVSQAGYEVVMTPSACASGTDRVAAAMDQLGDDFALVVNVQGDEPLIDPDDVDALVEETLASSHGMGTLARPLTDLTRFADPNTVKVVRAADGRAIYFSRAPIPHGEGVEPLLHIGLYAYRPQVLLALTRLAPSPLERAERLEQLRALEHGVAIHVAFARSAAPSIAIDTPEDVARVLAAIQHSSITRSAHATR